MSASKKMGLDEMYRDLFKAEKEHVISHEPQEENWSLEQPSPFVTVDSVTNSGTFLPFEQEKQ